MNKRREFTTEQKVRIVRLADEAKPGTISSMLKREKVTSSLLAAWRRKRKAGKLGTVARTPGVAGNGAVDIVATVNLRIASLEREAGRLRQVVELLTKVE